MKKYRDWKKVHNLSYLAFLLVSIHAMMIVADFRFNTMEILAFAMAVTVIAIFIQKFIQKRSASEQEGTWTLVAFTGLVRLLKRPDRE